MTNGKNKKSYLFRFTVEGTIRTHGTVFGTVRSVSAETRELAAIGDLRAVGAEPFRKIPEMHSFVSSAPCEERIRQKVSAAAFCASRRAPPGALG